MITSISPQTFFFQTFFFPDLSPHISERQRGRFSLDSSPQAGPNPGRDVNNFPSLLFSASVRGSSCLVLLPVVLPLGSQERWSHLHLAPQPPLPKQHCIYLTKIATSGWKNPNRNRPRVSKEASLGRRWCFWLTTATGQQNKRLHLLLQGAG